MKTLRTIVIGIGLAFLLIALARAAMILGSQPMIKSADQLEHTQTALVLGAGLMRDGSPTAPLRDRLEAAKELYDQGIVKVLLLSGDNRSLDYNEPEAMRRYLSTRGISDAAMVLDYAGRRTYDSCYRAKAIFGQSSLIIVTQRYHLYRAIYLCQGLEIESQGFVADRIPYIKRRYIYWNFREVGASLAAYWDILRKPQPVLGEPLPIIAP